MAVTLEINWFNYDCYQIMDVSPKIHEQVAAFMLKKFHAHELFKILQIQEIPGIEEDYLKIMKNILDNDCSIVVLHKDTKEVQGVALLKWMTKKWHSWLALKLVIENQHIKELYNVLINCFEAWKLKAGDKDSSVLDTLHLFAYHLTDELLQDEEFLQHFFNVISEVARHMHMPRVTCMCLSTKDREFMEKAGFVEVSRVIYSLYVFGGQRPFDRLRDVNEMYCGLFERKVAPLQPYREMLVRHQQNKDPKEEQKKSK